MFMKLALTSNYATAADMIADMKYIITGGTDKNALKSNVDKSLTFFDTSVSTSNWTLFDNVSTTEFVVRQPVYDDPSKYVYLRISASSPSQLYYQLCEGWNATTHAAIGFATNQHSQSSGFQSGASYYNVICASDKHFFLHCSNGTQSVLATARTRSALWDTVANGYLPYSLIGGNGSSGFHESLKTKKSNGTDSTSPTYFTAVTPFSHYPEAAAYNAAYTGFTYQHHASYGQGIPGPLATGVSDKIRNANGDAVEGMWALGARPLSSTYGSPDMIVNYSSLCDIWGIRNTVAAANGDELIANTGDVYVIIIVASNHKIAIRKG